MEHSSNTGNERLLEALLTLVVSVLGPYGLFLLSQEKGKLDDKGESGGGEEAHQKVIKAITNAVKPKKAKARTKA